MGRQGIGNWDWLYTVHLEALPEEVVQTWLCDLCTTWTAQMAIPISCGDTT